jgi:hypothetical protein
VRGIDVLSDRYRRFKKGTCLRVSLLCTNYERLARTTYDSNESVFSSVLGLQQFVNQRYASHSEL